MKQITPEEYLALEETVDYKSEYYNGEIFAMAGGSANHNRIAGNFYAVLTIKNLGCGSDVNIAANRLNLIRQC